MLLCTLFSVSMRSVLRLLCLSPEALVIGHAIRLPRFPNPLWKWAHRIYNKKCVPKKYARNTPEKIRPKKYVPKNTFQKYAPKTRSKKNAPRSKYFSLLLHNCHRLDPVTYSLGRIFWNVFLGHIFGTYFLGRIKMFAVLIFFTWK